MKPEVLRLLKEFDGPQVVNRACLEVFGQNMHFAVPAMLKQAVADGLLMILDLDGPITDGKATYSRDLMLTDKGREACGLPKVVVDATIEKPKKSVAKTLF